VAQFQQKNVLGDSEKQAVFQAGEIFSRGRMAGTANRVHSGVKQES
jgi:hypothetical protein